MKTLYASKLTSIMLPFVCLLGSTTLVQAAGPLSAPVPDGVTLINQRVALTGNVTPGDGPGFPVTLSLSGKYQLAGNLTVPDEYTDAIRIVANSVTLDLNGFSIVGPTVCSDPGGGVLICNPTGTGDGISPGPPANTDTTADHAVLNGTVRGMGGIGIVASRVKNVTVTSNGVAGIIAIGASMVSDSTVSFNGGDGIRYNGIGEVTGNTVHANFGFGLRVLEPLNRVGYGSNVFSANKFDGITPNPPQVSGGIEIATNVCGTDTICP